MAYFKDNSMNGKIPYDPWSLVQFIRFSSDQKKTYKLSEPVTVGPVSTDDAETAYGCSLKLDYEASYQ